MFILSTFIFDSSLVKIMNLVLSGCRHNSFVRNLWGDYQTGNYTKLAVDEKQLSKFVSAPYTPWDSSSHQVQNYTV
jgi:hypothetical protein